ncbi:MAG: hypothetical protein LAN18_07325 [Acidobacteriia bacterium]|nr:hypothetical protein [Terriglobia bacterium]
MRNKKAIRKRKATHGKRRAAQKKLAPRDWRVLEFAAVEPTGLGPNAAGQSGDIEGLSTVASGNSESVAELVEEGQDLEAEKVSGVENVPDADEAEVSTHDRKG